jgi:superkiller protein 3
LNDIIFAIILAFTFAVLFWILSLFVDYSVKGKKAKKKFIEFYKKYDEITPIDFRIAEYRDYYYKREESKVVSDALKERKNVLIIGRPKSGKTRTAYESIKEINDFKVVKLWEKLIEIDEIPNKIFKGKIVVFIDDLNKFVKNLDLYELIKKLKDNSKEFSVLATCRTGIEYDLIEKEFKDIILEFKLIELKDINDNEVEVILESEDLDSREFDGTIGSLFLRSKDMKIRYNMLPDECKFLFSTLKFLHDAGIFIPNKKILKNFNLKRLEKERIVSHLSFESTIIQLESNSFILEEKGIINALHESYLNFSNYITSINDLKWLKEFLSEIRYVSGLIYLGNAFYYKNLYDDSISCYEKAILINPEFYNAWYNKGKALGELGRYEEAIEAYDIVLEIESKNALAWNNKGTELAKLKRCDEAINAFDKALKIDPEFTLPWFNKGKTLFDLGRYEEAIEAYDSALGIDFKYPDAWNNKGTALAKLEKYGEAKESFDKALEADSKYSLAWYNKGKALEELGIYEEAIDAYDKALEIEPRYTDAFNNKGIVLGYLERYDEAIEAFDKALEIETKNSKVWYNKGTGLGKSGKYNEAIESFNKSLEIDPKYHPAWNNKGKALGELGRYEEAIEAYNNALEIDPYSELALSAIKELMKLI